MLHAGEPQYTVLVSKYSMDRTVTEDSPVDNDTGAETLLYDLTHTYLYNSKQEDYGGDITILSRSRSTANVPKYP